MQVLVRHDDTIQGSERLTALTTTAVEGALERFAEHITTVEVHYADENGKKIGGDDIRCTIEVRFEGRRPTAVSHHASDLVVALDTAAEKMARMLDHQLGRIRDQIAPPAEAVR
ncbi:MAG TPA: HPF/RaiA family ribosome-associated protein [Kofleriaceae bacterium]|nr:HPF/RaiA family ribosome-associated protein [Kofleriaceae bacterium]